MVARARPSEPTRIGGRYLVEATLGRGGMGAVYRVRDEASDRVLALKQMTQSGEDVDAAQLRFRREFHTMATLRHPRIVEVYDYGVDGAPYYTMELLDGRDLADLDTVSVKRACELLQDIASALAFLHARRLLHRDLAARNVRCTTDGRAKLIDFGVLATTGISGDVAGTPPFMAPESVLGRPLDHRYDLYGLGALAYRILTGKHAFPATTIEQLEIVWRDRPPPPSKLTEGIPPALDELVLALLASDPLARPADAAEVIDRLAAIGGLDRPPEIATTHGWIASAALVGRHREMAQIKRAIARAHDGSGLSLLIEAPSGTGKSRLLRELALEAQLAGMCVVRGEGDAAGRGPYGVFHALARQLLDAAPREAEAAARPYAGTLARVIPVIRDRLGAKVDKPHDDPADDRVHLQQALAAWILDLAKTKSIALLVDDIQRCDEASAAVLASLAHQAGDRKLLIGAALRSDENVHAASAIAAIADVGQRLHLRGLGEEEVRELCRSLFGDVPRIPRLAQWMHQIAGGSPLYTTELARHLVDRGVIRYVDGLWSIPEDPSREDLPKGLVEAMDARVRALSDEARALGEVLAIHGAGLPLDLIVALADTRDEGRVFAALDDLAFEEVLIQAGDQWRFRHDGLREAMLRALSDERRLAIHLRVGETLMAKGGGGPERDAEIGWHLLRGGDTRRGAELLERAGRALYASQSFSDCIPPLEAVVAVIDEHGGSARVRLELLHQLLMAGLMADHKAALRHADPCVEGFRYWSGVDVATRAKRYLGRYLGVVIGLCWAMLRWMFSPRRGPNPYEAFRTFFIVVGYASTIHSLGFEFARTKQLISLVEPVAMFKRRIPWAVYLLTCNTYHFPRGDIAITLRNSEQILDILQHDRLTPIREIDRLTGIGGARYMLALIDVVNMRPTLEHQLDEIRKLGLKFFDAGVEQARIVFHRFRGEEERALELEARLELLSVQLGSVWQAEAFMTVISSLGYAFARDMLGLRRTIEELGKLCADGMRYQPFLELARAEYLRERGEAMAARTKLELLVTMVDYPMLLVPSLPALAETLLVLGDHARARDVAQAGLDHSSAEETYNLHGRMRSLRTLALAEAALGAYVGAAQRLDDAIAEAAGYDSPLVSGSLHEARAFIALAAADTIAYDHHVSSTEQQFRRTRNPALVGRAQRLAEAGVRHASTTRARTAVDEPVTQRSSPGAAKRQLEPEISLVAVDAMTTPLPVDVRSWVSDLLAGCRGSSERAAKALQLVVTESRGASGYLYLYGQAGLELVAPAWGDEPPAEIARELAPTDEPPTVVDRSGAIGRLTWMKVPLTLRVAASQLTIGVVAVIAGAMSLSDPDPRLVEELARELLEAGDAKYPRTVRGAR